MRTTPKIWTLLASLLLVSLVMACGEDEDSATPASGVDEQGQVIPQAQQPGDQDPLPPLPDPVEDPIDPVIEDDDEDNDGDNPPPPPDPYAPRACSVDVQGRTIHGICQTPRHLTLQVNQIAAGQTGSTWQILQGSPIGHPFANVATLTNERVDASDGALSLPAQTGAYSFDRLKLRLNGVSFQFDGPGDEAAAMRLAMISSPLFPIEAELEGCLDAAARSTVTNHTAVWPDQVTHRGDVLGCLLSDSSCDDSSQFQYVHTDTGALVSDWDDEFVHTTDLSFAKRLQCSANGAAPYGFDMELGHIEVVLAADSLQQVAAGANASYQLPAQHQLFWPFADLATWQTRSLAERMATVHFLPFWLQDSWDDPNHPVWRVVEVAP